MGQGRQEHLMGQARQARRAILIVEDDAELRHLTAALFEDENVDTITCETAEAALATMLIRGREVAMIFAEIQLPGVMDGVDLASEVKMRWPLLPVVLTSGQARERAGDLPPGVDYMPKPWQPLDVLIAAEQALGSRGTRVMGVAEPNGSLLGGSVCALETPSGAGGSA
jgi:DNA-binding NtrC family response regulator